MQEGYPFQVTMNNRLGVQIFEAEGNIKHLYDMTVSNIMREKHCQIPKVTDQHLELVLNIEQRCYLSSMARSGIFGSVRHSNEKRHKMAAHLDGIAVAILLPPSRRPGEPG